MPALRSAPSPIRVAIADNDAAMRSALHDLLSTVPTVAVVATAPDGSTLLAMLDERQPHVAVIDTRMPFGGPELVRAVVAHDFGVAVICFSVDAGARRVMLAAGATAYVLKGDPSQDIVGAVHAAAGYPSALRGSEM